MSGAYLPALHGRPAKMGKKTKKRLGKIWTDEL